MTSTVNPVKMAKNGDYLTLSEVEAYGEAPGVTWKLLSDIGGRQTYAVVFKIGDEIATGLLAFARAHDVKAAHFTGLGAAQEVKVAWYELDRKEYSVASTFNIFHTNIALVLQVSSHCSVIPHADDLRP